MNKRKPKPLAPCPPGAHPATTTTNPQPSPEPDPPPTIREGRIQNTYPVPPPPRPPVSHAREPATGMDANWRPAEGPVDEKTPGGGTHGGQGNVRNPQRRPREATPEGRVPNPPEPAGKASSARTHAPPPRFY